MQTILTHELDKGGVITPAGELFSAYETRQLAGLIYKRVGRDALAATAAWERVMSRPCSVAEFTQLLGEYE